MTNDGNMYDMEHAICRPREISVDELKEGARMAQFEFSVLEFHPQKNLQGSSDPANLRPHEPWLSLGLEKEGVISDYPLSPNSIIG